MAGTSFDTTRVRLGDLVAGVAAVLLFLSLFLHWYSVSASSVFGSLSGSVSGWKILSFIDILLFLIAVVAIAVAVGRMAGALPRMAVSPGLIVLGLGVLATLLVLFRIIDTPGDLDPVANAPGVDVSRSFGIFVALIASLGITAGGWIGWNEEGRPRPGGVGRGAAGGPPVGAGPYGGGAQQPSAFDQPAQTQTQPPAAMPSATTPPATTPPATAAPEAAAPVAATPSPAPTPPQSVDAPPPGGAADWYPDPRGEKRLRYWDGTQWTHHTAD